MIPDPIERWEEHERLMLLSPEELDAEVEADRRWRDLMRRAERAERDEAAWRDAIEAQDDPYPW